MSKHVAIIGAGIGGLAVANLLAKLGHSVTVYEQHEQPGGRTGILAADGLTFDTGPSWYLMPEVFEHYFSLLGKTPADYYTLQRLTPAYKVFFDYHKPLVVTGDLRHDRDMFEGVETGSGNQLEQYVESAEKLYQTSLQNYLYNPGSLMRVASSGSALRDAPLLATLLAKPLHNHVAKSFHSLPLQQILEYPMVFLGASPFNAPSLYHLMSYLDFKQGVYYPIGGMYQIIQALTDIGAELGVQYNYRTPIEQIVVSGGRATGVKASGVTHQADMVISGADLHFTETKLLDETYQTYPQSYWHKKTAGPSALLMYLGVKGKLPQLEHHNLLFVQSWRQNFEHIFQDKQWPEHASMYISRTSASDPSVAPKGTENIFILIPVPAGCDQPEDLEKAADHYLAQLETVTGITDFRSRITYKSLRSTTYFNEAFNSWQGSALGMAHLLRQSAFWRPNSRSKKVSNLYYVGGGVQPGIGLPMCLISAELAVKHITGNTSPGPLQSLGELDV